MTQEELEELKKLRAEKIKSLNNNFTGVKQLYRQETESIEKLVAYKVNMRISDREYMKDYIYVMTQRLGRIYTMAEAVEDAVTSLKENCQFQVPIRPIK